MTPAAITKQPWIKNAGYDSLFILLPPFLVLAVVWLLPAQFKHTDAMPVMGWVILVLFVDVAHVYSTLYNTYFDKARFLRRKKLFILVPIVCYFVGFLLHLAGAMVFWRALAYVAVFHFIRQQYGFMRLYARNEAKNSLSSRIDTIVIYAATIYPLIYWHCTPGRNFNWFIPNDFFILPAGWVRSAAGSIYIVILAAWILKEARSFITTRKLNLPKNLLIAGTVISWYAGIVYFNGDMAFTMLNVVSHGIPYMALVWYGINKVNAVNTANPGSVTQVNSHPRPLSRHWYGLLVFLGSLFLLAYLEEGLWDGFVWQEHRHVFAPFTWLPPVSSDLLLAILAPLLSLPQSAHYVLDGFIWRKRYA